MFNFETGEPEEGFGFGTFLLYLKHTRPYLGQRLLIEFQKTYSTPILIL